MKKLLLLLTITFTALPAFAYLGDTYAQACHRFGGRGQVDQKNHAILWRTKFCWISERFIQNRCVFVLLTPFEGRHYEDSDVGQVLASVSSQQWTHYRQSDGTDDLGEWATADGSMVAGLYICPGLHTTQIQVSYKWYMASKGLLNRPDDDPGSAPVEDTPRADM